MNPVLLPPPLGPVTLRWSARGLTAALFDGPPAASEADPHGAAEALLAWLAGDLAALDHVPVDPPGTPFQHAVWAELRRIPPGTTISYQDLANRLGDPAATRAVARANATNPVGIFIPCHRVIGTDGKVTGYAGGLHRKRWLLAHEGAPGFLVP